MPHPNFYDFWLQSDKSRYFDVLYLFQSNPKDKTGKAFEKKRHHLKNTKHWKLLSFKSSENWRVYGGHGSRRFVQDVSKPYPQHARLWPEVQHRHTVRWTWRHKIKVFMATKWFKLGKLKVLIFRLELTLTGHTNCIGRIWISSDQR